MFRPIRMFYFSFIECDWLFDSCDNPDSCEFASPGFPGIYPQEIHIFIDINRHLHARGYAIKTYGNIGKGEGGLWYLY